MAIIYKICKFLEKNIKKNIKKFLKMLACAPLFLKNAFFAY
jgi:hypothetical protein